MLELLEEVKAELPDLMISEDSWQSLLIDYHHPVVSRLWMPWKDYRLFLHKIHPRSRENALFHPHPWPSAMEIVYGTYEYAVGFGKGKKTPPIAQLGKAVAGSSYEMTHPDAWHYVAPLKFPAYTIMITGKPWNRWSPTSTRKLSSLFESDKTEILNFFRHHLGYRVDHLSHDIRYVATTHMNMQPSSYYACVAHVAKCQQCQDRLKDQFNRSLRLPTDAD